MGMWSLFDRPAGLWRWRWATILAVVAVLVGVVPDAQGGGPVPSIPPLIAATTIKDVMVAVRAINFVTPAPTGATPIAILYAADTPGSLADAKAILAFIELEPNTGRAQLQPILVNVAELDQLHGIRFALVAFGLDTHYDAIAAAARTQGILSICADPACAQTARCVMAVTSEPRVQVTVNRSAAVAAHVEFSTAFRMLINEL